jgi:Type IV secretion-system coupling protein DNA-binding domain
MNPPHDVFTPLSHRFTDERARNAKELQELHRRVKSAHRSSPWGREDAIEAFYQRVVEQVTSQIELPKHAPLLQAFDTCMRGLLAAETTVFSVPPLDPMQSLSFREQVDLTSHLQAQEAFLANPAPVADQLGETLFEFAASIIRLLPRFGASSLTVPLVTIVRDGTGLLDQLFRLFVRDELLASGFKTTASQLYLNICAASGVQSSAKPSAFLFPSASNLPLERQVTEYFGDTPFEELLLTPVPFDLPDEQRFAGHWIIAPPGRGKTTLLHTMLLDDLDRKASIIIMDSKGDLIEPFKLLPELKDRLLLIEPDAEAPLALNPLDIPSANIAHTIALLEYVLSTLLEAKPTALQTSLFRKLLPAFLELRENPTIEELRRMLIEGVRDLPNTLSASSREFLTDREHGFDSKTYRGTREQLTWRLDLLLSNPILKAMFGSLKTKLDIGKEMDAGKIIIINNSKALLGEEGAEFFGRFFIALILAAAQQRAGRPNSEKQPCFFYIDECHNVIKNDTKIPTILDECRSQKIALILAHQRTAQLSDAVLDAVANCAIRFANSDDEARYLSDKLRTTTDVLRKLKRGRFAAFVRDMTDTAVAVDVPYFDLSKLPKMEGEELAAFRAQMSDQFSFTPTQPPPAQTPPTPVTPSASVAKPQPAAKKEEPEPPPDDTPSDESTDW